MDSRYQLICKLINEEVDEIMTNTEDIDMSENTRDDVLVDYINFIKKDLVSDNY